MKWFGVALGAGFVAAVLAAVFGTSAVAAPSQPGMTGPATFAERLLIAHNLERDRVGVLRLRWSAKLAGQAQSWADTLARNDRLQHAEHRDGAGENLWMGRSRSYSAEQMVDGFVSEARHYRAGRFPDVSRTGSWQDVGHYTQVVWRGTREVGCGVAQGRSNDVLVCRYFLAGNVVGEQAL